MFVRGFNALGERKVKYWRRLSKFEYLAPQSIQEVCSLLERENGNAKVMAGGTVLLARWKERLGITPYLIGLKKVSNLDYITFDEVVGLKIGALATHRIISNSPLIRKRFEILAVVCGGLGSPQIRNMGTIGGNLCCRFPSAETIPPLIALGAEVKIVKSDGERTIPVEGLSKEPLMTELLTEVRVPLPSSRSGGAYLKYTIREAIDYPTVNVGVVLTLDSQKCKDIKIVIGAAGPFPFRAKKAESIVKANFLNEKVISDASQAAWEEASPLSDMYFSADYKKELIKVLTKRAIKQAWNKAEKT